MEPVISLTVRAYDLGTPSLDSEVLVHIFTEQTSSRTMKFIVYEDPQILSNNKNEVSDLISVLTGGDAEIQHISPYTDSGSIDRMDYVEVDYITNRDAKDYTSDPNESDRPRRSIVDALVTYTTKGAVVDINDITSKLQVQTTSESPSAVTRNPDEMVMFL